MSHIYILDLLGTFVFACYGSYYALKKDFDIFGILVCAFLTAVGGGTIRELILNHVPFYFFDMAYAEAIIAGIAFTIIIFKHFHRINRFMLVLDGIGLVVFALIGASKAHEMGFGLLPIVFFATVTSVGGGLLRDMVLNDVPEIMYKDFYATVAILLGFTFWLGEKYANNIYFLNLLIVAFFIVRVLAIFYKVGLWKPKDETFIGYLRETGRLFWR
ncbi:MAG: trimeric intracellular cation channel family protein [Candidatus Gracilibacteria bacterium]|jgi:uncharacterized membrane protein YeiH